MVGQLKAIMQYRVAVGEKGTFQVVNCPEESLVCEFHKPLHCEGPEILQGDVIVRPVQWILSQATPVNPSTLSMMLLFLSMAVQSGQ